MTVILGFMAVAIFLSLLVSHLAMRLSEALLTRSEPPPWGEDLDERLRRDQIYSTIL